MLEHDTPFNIDDFVDKLVPVVSTTQGWEVIGWRALARSKRVPIATFMYVSLVLCVNVIQTIAGTDCCA